MFLSPFLATRYIQPKRTFVSIITVISILGVSLGVWAMIVVMSVFTGYGERVKESILGFEPHMVIRPAEILRDWVEPYQKIKEMEGVASVTPFVEGNVVMEFKGLRSAPVIRGILPPEGAELERLRKKIVRRPDPKDPTKEIPMGDFFGENDFYSAVVGSAMAEAQGINVGDKILLYSPRDMNALMESLEAVEGADEATRRAEVDKIRQLTAPQEVTVTGIFESGYWQFDATYLIVHLETAQVLYNFDLEESHGIAVRTDNAFKVNDYEKNLLSILPSELMVHTWGQINKVVFDAIAAERQAMFLILFIIMIVGSFGIMSTMITVTVQKRTEIGLLKAIGAVEGQIAWIFLLQGMLVGLAGVALGLIMAEVTLYYRNDLSSWIGRTYGVDIFSAEAYGVDGGLPAVKTPRDLAIIMTSAFACCTLAALVPAIIAAYLQPAKALRSQ